MSQFAQALGSRKAVELIELANKTCLVLSLVNGPDTMGPDGRVLQPGCKRPPVVYSESFETLELAVQSVVLYWSKMDDCCDECKEGK